MLNMVSKEKMDKVQQDLNKVTKTSEEIMKENDADLQEVLTSGQSFSERDRIRRNNGLQEASASKSNNYRRPIGHLKVTIFHERHYWKDSSKRQQTK